jgi:hypothetical protein
MTEQKKIKTVILMYENGDMVEVSWKTLEKLEQSAVISLVSGVALIWLQELGNYLLEKKVKA